jgi:hypothetical protein
LRVVHPAIDVPATQIQEKRRQVFTTTTPWIATLRLREVRQVHTRAPSLDNPADMATTQVTSTAQAYDRFFRRSEECSEGSAVDPYLNDNYNGKLSAAVGYLTIAGRID